MLQTRFLFLKDCGESCCRIKTSTKPSRFVPTTAYRTGSITGLDQAVAYVTHHLLSFWATEQTLSIGVAKRNDEYVFLEIFHIHGQTNASVTSNSFVVHLKQFKIRFSHFAFVIIAIEREFGKRSIFWPT